VAEMSALCVGTFAPDMGKTVKQGWLLWRAPGLANRARLYRKEVGEFGNR
jgi:hypothetical protein